MLESTSKTTYKNGVWQTRKNTFQYIEESSFCPMTEENEFYEDVPHAVDIKTDESTESNKDNP
jgi:hypothetical protein